MNAPKDFEHEHLSYTCQIQDARKNPTLQLAWHQCYFVGFRIAASIGDRFHHAMILADDYYTFLHGVASVYLALRDYSWIQHANEVSVVFIHNEPVQDPESKLCISPQKYLQPIIKSDSQNNFTVLGINSKYQLCSVQIDTDNALQAIDDANDYLLRKFGFRFQPTQVCNGHPVTIEFYGLLENAKEHFRHLVCDLPDETAFFH